MSHIGSLYLIPNTLGSDESIPSVLPPDVQKTAQGLSYFIVENAKPARQFLKAVGLNIPLQEAHIQELNAKMTLVEMNQLIQPLLAGHDVGLISDAGCPAVADPGALVVAAAHQHQITVKPLVGPSSILLGLMGSGLNGQSFAFHGYLPIDRIEREQKLKALEQDSLRHHQTQLFIETPYRNDAMLQGLCQTLKPHTRLCVATDLTLSSEKIITLTIKEWKNLIKSAHKPDLHKHPTLFLFLA